jgi:hypothetical protein
MGLGAYTSMQVGDEIRISSIPKRIPALALNAIRIRNFNLVCLITILFLKARCPARIVIVHIARKSARGHRLRSKILMRLVLSATKTREVLLSGNTKPCVRVAPLAIRFTGPSMKKCWWLEMPTSAFAVTLSLIFLL